jgi:hypothetical protein
MVTAWLQRSSKTTRGRAREKPDGGNTGLNNGWLVRSRRRDRGHRKEMGERRHGAILKDRYGEPERGGVNGSR